MSTAAVSTRSLAPAAAELVGQSVELVYSRVDADGTLREARVAPAGPAADSS